MNTKQILTAILFLSFFISCDKSQKDSLSTNDFTITTQQEQQKPEPAQFQAQSTDSAGPIPGITIPTTAVDWDKKIIKTATLRLEVPDFKKYNESVRQTVRQYGGYIAQEEQGLSEEKYENSLSIKVPVAQFEPMMNQLPGADTKVLERKINTDNVTGQVVDTKSRLEAKKQMRLKYLDFLKQSKNMEEVLQVQHEINSIQEEIEAAATRLNYLSTQSAFSTINLSFNSHCRALSW